MDEFSYAYDSDDSEAYTVDLSNTELEAIQEITKVIFLSDEWVDDGDFRYALHVLIELAKKGANT